jgi:cytoskeleton protein RodZ
VIDVDTVAEIDNTSRQHPGAVLRDTREKQGLTLAEVAGALKFSTRQIEALERDDFAQLSGKTFLRGFIRAYARLLKLEVEPLLALLDAEDTLPQEQIVAPGNMGETNPVPIYRRYARSVLLLIVGLAVAAGVAWYALDLRSAPEVAPTIAINLPVEQSSEPVPLANSTTTDIALSASAVQVVAPPTLGFEFNDLSWLEVKDGNGQILLTGEFPRGQKQSVNGNPPYQVWIGKASAVKMTYRDQPFDFQPYVREEVARFSIDK